MRCAAQFVALHSVQRWTALGATQRPALHCAQRFTAHSVIQCAAFYTPPPPALHSAQHYTAPSTTLHQAQRAKTRPIAASEPSIYKWWNISVGVERLLRSNGTRPCKSYNLAHARAPFSAVARLLAIWICVYCSCFTRPCCKIQTDGKGARRCIIIPRNLPQRGRDQLVVRRL